jgi:hypothetical protein
MSYQKSYGSDAGSWVLNYDFYPLVVSLQEAALQHIVTGS